MTPQYNDNIYNLLGTFGFTGAFNDRWKGYLNSFGLAGTNNDMLYSFLGQLGYVGSLTDRWNSYLDSVGGSFVGFTKLYLNFADGTNLLDPRINFSRTTNATVTNSAGLITYAPHNFLTHSEQFDNAAWTKSSVTVTANTTLAPDGTLTADTLTATGASGVLSQDPAKAGNITNSIYIKRKTGTGNIQLINAAGAYTTVTVTNEWTRVSTTASVATAISLYRIRIITSGDEVYIWGAQSEISDTATTYNPTTVKNLLGFSELFDNAAWTKSNSFVQTNLVTYSEDFSNALWVKTTTTVATNTDIAPNGYQTADTLAATGSNSRALQTFTASAVAYTFSVWLKRKTGTGNIDITVDGTTYVTKTITNDWTRVETTLTPAAGSKTAGIRIVTSGDEVYAWGAQLVQGSVAGDYRRTDAAALPVYYPNHNGVVVAEKLAVNTATSTHTLTAASITTVAGTTYTYSAYLKAAGYDFAVLYISGANVGRYFDLSNGTVGNVFVGAPLSQSITNMGNGWYRCSITYTATAASFPVIYTNQTQTSTFAGDGTSGTLVFGAQLSDSASLDPYVLNAAAAPTAAAFYGARFDYDPVTLQPKGLLIEEQRSNLLTFSEQFNNAIWTKLNQTVTANTIASPTGEVNADTITRSSTITNDAACRFTTTQAINTTNTLSVYMKQGTVGNFGYLRNIAVDDTVTTGLVKFNLSNGTIDYTYGSTYIGKATITNVGNGWYCCSITGTTPASIANNLIDIGQTSSGVNGGTINNFLYIWGAQLEVGAFATSYIPTVASQVTRAADVATIQGSNFYSWYRTDEGAFVADWQGGRASGSNDFRVGAIGANNANTNFWIALNGDGLSMTTWFGGSAPLYSFTSPNFVTVGGKMGVSYSVAGILQAAGGTVDANDTSISTMPLVTEINLGARASSRINGTIKSISYYPQRLSDNVLKGLTA